VLSICKHTKFRRFETHFLQIFHSKEMEIRLEIFGRLTLSNIWVCRNYLLDLWRDFLIYGVNKRVGRH